SAAAQQVGKLPPAFPPEMSPQQQKGVTIPAPKPGGKLGLRIYTLRNADATRLAKVLTDFLGEPRRPLLITVYAETNTLLVQASPEDLDLIELLIARLENPPQHPITSR